MTVHRPQSLSLYDPAIAKEAVLASFRKLDPRELVRNPELALGVAAPYETPPELLYRHLFSMDWSLVTPPRHPLLQKRQLRLPRYLMTSLVSC